MPKKPMDYSKTSFYKLVCTDPRITECYVGSTTNAVKRKYQHRCVCNNSNSKQYNLPVYQFIRNNGGFINWDMLILEETSCENAIAARLKERMYLEREQATLNVYVPSRNDHEYYIDNRETLLAAQLVYNAAHRVEIAEYRANHRVEKTEYNREYRAKNKEMISLQKREYQAKNRESINLKKREKYQAAKKLAQALQIVSPTIV